MEEDKLVSEEEIINLIRKQATIYLSTIEGNMPRVRPVTMVKSGSRYFILTGSNDAKVKQIRKNNLVEVCYKIKEEKGIGYIRVDGSIDIVNDEEMKRQIADQTSYFNEYWSSPEDPNYTLLEFNMNNVEFLKPGDTYAKKFKKGE